uniref:enoyl-[acyl-carrier-protein] reductase n=1 Tax=Aplanochytrium stocchinoi TaxID=215587 RepID=A0A7S3PK15_9STRA|mmetsp:Transcript_2259/g.2891  ORF Transcript_2259/g.2891 Transcript_2259/m.2891 type:complete len:307 (+) Transcript_2259:133-1053(+)|eukprot:CAMPEP_0204835238 /NCGR_PEP_ID=MMETSP1346-20131115/21966_1 /ASSEMBLY_ACC=CAM_ASM_000771 /TAXON_ID=215587 /ORGANISM="Aplanochytrium stocchinoi, Strain GSBS06" /LENGTH=306 /DNA_ID=CAMNT_0051969055 /DNA_START=267 /DNA_END=1187 /DNA_ORIENTATION=-
MNSLVLASRRLLSVTLQSKVSAGKHLRSIHSVTSGKNGFEVSDTENQGKVGAKQVKIKMLAASLTYQNVLNNVAGTQGVGVVEEIGGKVSSLKKGDHVAVSHPGTWTRSAVVDSASVVAVPSDIPAEDLTSLIFDTSKALNILNDAGVKAGDVLIHNYANGPLGLPLVQLAKEKGAKVISILTKAVDYKGVADSLKAAGSDVVVDEHFLGTETFKALVSENKPTVCVSFANGANLEALEAMKSCAGSGCKIIDAENVPDSFVPEATSIIKEGKLKQNMSVVDFEQFTFALPLVETMSVNGSLVLKM